MIDFESLSERRKPLAVVGLGYVGLPLAVAFSHHFDVVGFDISERRIEELKSGHDHTREVPEDRLQAAKIRFPRIPRFSGTAPSLSSRFPRPSTAIIPRI